MRKFKVGVLANEIGDHQLWIAACKKREDTLDFSVINFVSDNWFDQCTEGNFDLFLTKPGGVNSAFKELYDERLHILTNELDYKAYPSMNEVKIYENKRYISFWLKAHQIPHPKTSVFYNEKEALEFLNRSEFPLVGKLNIGASGSGVTILKSKEVAEKYINKIFMGKSVARKAGPNLKRGGLLKRGFHYVKRPQDIFKKLELYRAVNKNKQTSFVILQEFIPHDFEWRVVRIGESFFAHKKLVKAGKASGSLLKNYDNPPLELLDFVQDLTGKHELYSQAVDVFETNGGEYLVNEMQCIFGQSDPYQMLVNGKPGRYIYKNNEWIFEEGMFNTNESYDLRLNFALYDLLKK